MGDDFYARSRAAWEAAITQVFGAEPPRSAHWRDADDIIRVLTPFAGIKYKRVMLPTGFDDDIKLIAHSPETGCLELADDGWALMFRPADLYFEYFPESPWNSFFLLETQELSPSGVYKGSDRHPEEVVEISPGEYVDQGLWDDGVLSHDEDGNEIPFPETSRIVFRYRRGKFLFLAKDSIWGRFRPTLDGRHTHMTTELIRGLIQRAIDG